MLGIVTPPVLLSIQQIQIITPICNKINTFFEKITEFIFQKPCQVLFSAPDFFYRQHFAQRKSAKKFEGCRKILCKLKCITRLYAQKERGLWKKLWKMWKSYGYQSSFFKNCSDSSVENLYNRVNNRLQSLHEYELCRHDNSRIFFFDLNEKVSKSAFWGGLWRRLSGLAEKFFVKFAQILRLYDFSPTGNNEKRKIK